MATPLLSASVAFWRKSSGMEIVGALSGALNEVTFAPRLEKKPVSRKLSVLLPAELRAEEQRVAKATRLCRDDQIRLIEDVVASRGVVVRGDRDGRAGGVDGAGEDVLVELVVIAVGRAVSQRDARPEPVLDERRDQVDGGVGRDSRPDRRRRCSGSVSTGRPLNDEMPRSAVRSS